MITMVNDGRMLVEKRSQIKSSESANMILTMINLWIYDDENNGSPASL